MNFLEKLGVARTQKLYVAVVLLKKKSTQSDGSSQAKHEKKLGK